MHNTKGEDGMRAVLCHDFTGPEDLTVGEIETPTPGPKQVLVQVSYASVSFMDVLMVSGGYQMRPETPYVPGTEAAGTVAEVGAEVTDLAVGDRVACMGWYGGFGEFMAIDADFCVRLPDGVDEAPAATLIHNYLTAYYGLVERANVQPGETVFVTGAAGGVGLATVDTARHLGARVIAGVGSDDKADLVREYGAADVVNYREEDLRARIKDVAGGRGVDVCFDNVGGDIFLTMARLMERGGRLLPIGFTSGDIPKLPMNLPLLKNYDVIGVFMGDWREHDRPAGKAATEELMEWLAAGDIRPHVGAVLPLDQAAEAMTMVADRKTQGRVLLDVAA